MKNIVISLILFIISLLIGIFCSYMIFRVNGADPVNVLFVLIMAISFPAMTILHELGHILFGAVVSIKVVPDLSKKNILCWSSCKIKPKTDKNLKSRIIFTTLGGLAVNFIFMVVGVIALFVPKVPVEIGICVLPASFYLFMLNALPLCINNGKTDGLVISELAKNDDSAKVMLCVLTVQAQVLNGKPIEEVDEKLLFDVPQIQEDDVNFIALTNLRYEYFKAKGDRENAEKYAERFEQLKQYLPD